MNVAVAPKPKKNTHKPNTVTCFHIPIPLVNLCASLSASPAIAHSSANLTLPFMPFHCGSTQDRDLSSTFTVRECQGRTVYTQIAVNEPLFPKALSELT